MRAISKFYILCLLFCLANNYAFAQKWGSVGPRINTLDNEGPDVMYADSNYLYMAGAFHLINGMHMQGITRWNGIQWDSMGAGIDGASQYDSLPGENPGNTWAITTYHNKLYVGGAFSSLGKINAPGIGTWNGTAWDSIPVNPFIGQLGSVGAIVVINDKLYVGGAFVIVAGFPCKGIACWNDTNWSSLNFPNLSLWDGIGSICEYKGSIYVGGHFGGASGTIGNILRYDSTGWHSVDTGIKGGADWIMSMAVYNGELYVAGYFFKADGNVGDNIQRWDGTSWHGVGGGINWEVFNLMVFNGKLYATGSFSSAGGIPADRIAEWDGTKWCSVGSRFDNTIETGCIYKDSLYIGGGFRTIDGDSLIYIAKWTGGNYTDTCGNDATGVDKLKAEKGEVSIFPNPNNGIFIIQSAVSSGQLLVEIYNVLGKKIYSEILPQNQANNTVNLTGQPNGVYFYRVLKKTGELAGSGKIIVQQ